MNGSEHGTLAGDAHRRLDSIPTPWSLIVRAHAESPASIVAVRNHLAARYHEPIRRYLTAILQNHQDAAEVTQKMVVRILEGAFDQVDRRLGRFRDYMKRAVRNEALKFLQQSRRQPSPLPPGVDLGREANDDSDFDRRFLEDCRRSLLNSALQEIEDMERRRPHLPYYTVLRLRREFPDDDADTLSSRLAGIVKRPIQPGTVRQHLRRARLTLAHRLVEHVSRSLKCPDPQEVEQELIDLGLMPFVRRYMHVEV